MRILIMILFLSAGLLAACGIDEDDDPPSVLDINPANEAQRQTLAVLSATPPTATPPPATLGPPTNTPLPTVERASPTPPIDRTGFSQQVIRQGAWQTAPFTDMDGETRTLEEFIGQVVVVQSTSMGCFICQDQTRLLYEAARELQLSNNTQRVVFVVLGVNARDTLEDLADYQANYGPALDDDALTWVTGLASQTLLRDLRAGFGEYIVQTQSSGLFFMDVSGYGHISDQGVMNASRLRDVILHFLGANFIQTPEPSLEATADAPPEALSTPES